MLPVSQWISRPGSGGTPAGAGWWRHAAHWATQLCSAGGGAVGVAGGIHRKMGAVDSYWQFIYTYICTVYILQFDSLEGEIFSSTLKSYVALLLFLDETFSSKTHIVLFSCCFCDYVSDEISYNPDYFNNIENNPENIPG